MRCIDDETIRKAITSLGFERLLAALPRHELRRSLALVSTGELAQMLGVQYSTLRWHIAKGRIPRPSVRLVRRAYDSGAQAGAIAEVWRTEKSSGRKSTEPGQ